MKRWWSLLLLLLLLVAGCRVEPTDDTWQPEGPLDCRAELSTESASLLGAVELKVQVYYTGDMDGDLKFSPAVPKNFTGSVDHKTVERGDGRLHTFVLHLRPTKLGALKIAPFVIPYGDETVSTPELDLEVTSVLRASDDVDAVEAPRDPFSPLVELWPWIVAAAAVVLLAAFVWWWRRRPRREPKLPVEVPLPPWVQALRELSRLRQMSRETEDEIEVFYVDVSHVLRVYLEDRFGLHAPMRSTEEFLIEVEQGKALGPAHRQSLRAFLHQCDMVKFARLMPDADVHEQTLLVAEEFVEETRADRVRGGAA